MSKITTHVLDTTRGRPAAGVRIIVHHWEGGEWVEIGAGETNADGRILHWPGEEEMPEYGIYMIRFATGAYFKSAGAHSFYPFVEIIFEIIDDGHYHIPLLLSPYGYTTYRGS